MEFTPSAYDYCVATVNFPQQRKVRISLMQEEQTILMTGGGTLGAIGAVNTIYVLVYLTFHPPQAGFLSKYGTSCVSPTTQDYILLNLS